MKRRILKNSPRTPRTGLLNTRTIRSPVPAACLALLFLPAFAGGLEISLDGAVEWDKMELNASLSLDLASADIRLPTGRTQGEAVLRNEYLRLIRPAILSLPVDSSSTVGDLVNRGEYSLPEAETLALAARSAPPFLSADLLKLSSRYFLSLSELSAALVRHRRPEQIPHTVVPGIVPEYTGIIIMAAEELPVHGKNGKALPLPCLFPKIWDTDMNLVFEKAMLDPSGTGTMVRYVSEQAVFHPGPSGLSEEAAAAAGERPLRIIARGVFGIRPTDLIIDRADSLLVVSSEANRRLLSQGRVVIALNDRVLKSPLVQ